MKAAAILVACGLCGSGAALAQTVAPPSAAPKSLPTFARPVPATGAPTWAGGLPPPPPPADPNRPPPDVAFGAYQRGYFVTALREAQKRVSADPNDAAAMTLLGVLYEDGYGVKRNVAESVRWLQAAANHGDRQATFLMGLATLRGNGVPADRGKAKALFQTAAAAGHPGALYNVGIMAIEDGDFTAAGAAFRRAAMLGDDDGAYSLALLLRDGKGVIQDDVQAAMWLRRAADDGKIDAEVEYAIALFNGDGVDKDEAAAARYFYKAAGASNPIAENRLARMLAVGRGVPKNMIEAMKWHILARAAGLSDEWLDGLLNALSPQERVAVDEAVKRFVGNVS